MNDAVDTADLRRDARVLAPGFPGVATRLIAAADKVDQLRGEHVRAIEQFNEVCERSDLKNAELRRLWAAIDKAPHDVGCATPAESLLGAPRAPERPCTCWKADML